MAATLYKIPERHIDGFKLLIDLPEDKRKILVESIQKLQIGEYADKILKDLSTRIGISEQNSNQIIDALTGLLFVKEETSEKLEEFTKDILEAYSIQSKNRNFDEKKLSLLLVNFIRSSKNFKTTLKANHLRYEREKILTRSRILTDIRPVFDDNDGQIVQGSVIIHNLSLDFSENGKTKKLFFAIDSDDIREFQKILQRALDKETSIRDSLKNSSLKNLEL